MFIALTIPREELQFSPPEQSSFWETAGECLSFGGLAFLFTGIPSLAVVLLAGILRRKTESATFRGAIAFTLIFLMLPLTLVSTAYMLFVQLAVQVLFAVFVMPVPLVRGSPVGR
ncbi:hypothetical protein [Streptomyces sp. NPDC050504]|uniref:hypothetical protein n=1 Tax=Streptomyces sp. NPDC050504 TaxID=3365618 RepID=UPI0037A68F32